MGKQLRTARPNARMEALIAAGEAAAFRMTLLGMLPSEVGWGCVLSWDWKPMNSSNQEVEADEWDFYFSNVNGVLSSLMVNLSAIRRPPAPDKPWLLWVWVYMRASRDDGLSSEEEAPKLYDIEDKLTQALAGPCTAELLGRITGDKRREFYYYAATSDGLESAVETVRSAFPEYAIKYEGKRDPAWRQYRDVLYPSPMDLQKIHNRRVLIQLEKHGDDHAIPRDVDHAIYFRTAQDRAGFVNAAVGSGFRVEHQNHDAGSRIDRPFFLNLIRRDAVTLSHINDVVMELVHLALRFDGDYDGWGCEVEKPGSTCPADQP
jgi:uncharacterized protein (TIGR01619 family)